MVRPVIQYRLLARSDIPQFSAINRYETIDSVYCIENGNLIEAHKQIVVTNWSSEEKQRRINDLEIQYDRGATFFGAFHVAAPQPESSLVGVAVLSIFPIESGKDRFNLAGLWVSAEYRGQGIGHRLVELALREAQVRGAKSVYVSATPSGATVRFYQSIGFQLTGLADPTLYAKEPEDIHMELRLV